MFALPPKADINRWHRTLAHHLFDQLLEMPRNVKISTLVTEELAKKLEALAAKEQRLLSSMIAIFEIADMKRT